MADQNDILRVLVTAREPLSLDEVCRLSLGAAAPVGSNPRKQVVKCLGRLIGRGLAKALTAHEQAFPRTQNGGYEATKDGRAFEKAGRNVSEHVLDYPAVTKPKVGPKANGDAFRDDLWKAFRFKKKASLRELIEVVDKHGVVKVDTLAAAWMKALIGAGVAVLLPVRERGFAPTSNGFKRYALLRDLGPKPPKPAADFLLDQNTGERIAFAAAKPSKSEAA